MAKKDIKIISQVLIAAAALAVMLAAVGYLFADIWLASTQWLLVASVFALFGVYTKLEG